jgi:CspA family cold shock protein
MLSGSDDSTSHLLRATLGFTVTGCDDANGQGWGYRAQIGRARTLWSEAFRGGPAAGYPRHMQGVVKSYDPITRDGVVMRDTDMAEFDLAGDALKGSIFRMLRPGQRVVFHLNDAALATGLGLGSEIDMGTPAWIEKID